MNTFGSASLQFGLFDPKGVRANRERFRRNAVPALDRANSFYCPAGRWPAKGWLLMSRDEYISLISYSTSLQLNIGDTRNADNVQTLKNLSIVQAQCVTRGLASDTNALYLVEVTDARGILCNEWFQFPATAYYNIRAPAYPQTFYPLSLNSGTTWTWSTMIRDLWLAMTQLGAWPGLPSAPAGTPEGFWFLGVPAWTALCDLLDHLGMTVACDLTAANPYTIVAMGAADAAATALQTRYLTNLEDDLEWIDTGAGRVPKTVKVLFRRRNGTYGTEELVRYDPPFMTPSYEVSVTAPATFSSAIGTHSIWSDFTVRYDIDGVIFAADAAMAASIAAERATQYFNKVYWQTTGYMSKAYAGALPFKVGSQVDGVAWVQDYANQSRQGWRTMIVRGARPPWPGLWGSYGRAGGL